jgi:lycopene beta-cyclase
LLDRAGHFVRVGLIPLVESDDWRGAPGKLLIAWLTTMILMPIAQWIIGDPSLIAGVILSVVLQCSVSVALLNRAAGWRRTLLIAATVAIMGWAAEALGSHTGIPFGAYHYTSSLQPQLLGVPLLIPLAWLMMLPPAWAVAQRLTGRTRGWQFVLVSSLAFTAWDLFLDPQMVLWGLWAWDQPGQYFGIPLVNYLGWFVVSALITAVARPPVLRVRPLLVVYTLTWLIESMGLTLFWGLYGPALSGFIGMGVFVVTAWRAENSSRQLETAATTAKPAHRPPASAG